MPESPTNPTRHTLFVFVLGVMIVLLAAVVRFHMLDAQSLWNDEGNAYVQATRTMGEIADNAARDIHPPGYYWVLAIWRVLTGETEFALRSLSALAGIITVALTFALGRRLYGLGAGVVAALIVALNTFNIYYSQEARMYALLAMWAVAGMWAFVGLVRASDAYTKRNWAIALALVNAAGLWTHYVYPAMMLIQGALFIAYLGAVYWQSKKINLRLPGLYIAANLATIALYAVWVPTAWAQVTTWPNTGAPIPAGEALSVILGWFSLGMTYEYSQLTVAFAFFALFGLLSFPREDGRLTWWRMLVSVVWALAIPLAFLAFGFFRDANLKFLLPAQIGFALWVGRGAWVLWHLVPKSAVTNERIAPLIPYIPKAAAILGTAALMFALLTGLTPLYTVSEFQRDDYRGIVERITADSTSDKAIILNAPGQAEVFNYYYDDTSADAPVYLLPIGMTVDESATLDAVNEIIDAHDRIYAVLWGTDERDPNGIVENTLDSDAYEIDSVWYGSVRLVRYVTPDVLQPIQSVGARFGDAVNLESYALNAQAFAPDDTLLLQLNWSTDAPLEINYKVFVQLLDVNGDLALQRDAEPVGGQRPTSTWQIGETIEDNHALILPDDLSGGDYTLIVGLYESVEPYPRLTLADGNDNLVLETITVQSR